MPLNARRDEDPRELETIITDNKQLNLVTVLSFQQAYKVYLFSTHTRLNKNFEKKGSEPMTNSTHINIPCHIGGRRVLSPVHHLSTVYSKSKLRFIQPSHCPKLVMNQEIDWGTLQNVGAIGDWRCRTQHLIQDEHLLLDATDPEDEPGFSTHQVQKIIATF